MNNNFLSKPMGVTVIGKLEEEPPISIISDPTVI